MLALLIIFLNWAPLMRNSGMLYCFFVLHRMGAVPRYIGLLSLARQEAHMPKSSSYNDIFSPYAIVQAPISVRTN